MHTALDELLAYKNPSVVRRFIREHSNYSSNAETIFSDLMRFFWASRKHAFDQKTKSGDPALDFVFIMDEDMRAIDQMWHVFLLYTQDYTDFCDRYFGEFLHHLPDIVPTLDRSTFDPETNLTRFLNYNYDVFGEEVIRRWFSDTINTTLSA